MTSADTKIRDRLREIREQTREVRERRAEARKERDAAKDAFANADFTANGDPDITQSAEFKAAEEAVRKEGNLADELETLRETEQGILKLLGADNTPLDDNSRPGRTNVIPSRWDGHALLAESEDFREARDRGIFRSSHQFGTVTVGELTDRAGFVAALPTAPNAPGGIATDQGAVAPDVRGIVSPPLGPLTLLDVFPTGITDSNIIQFVQVTGIPGYAAETAELAAKPGEGLAFFDATAPVRTIAGWIKLSRQSLEDIASLGSLINTTLPWDVRRRIQAQMLAGDGTGQNLTGILTTSGLGAPASATGDNVADGILRAITTVVLSDQDPNFAALNPLTWQNLLMLKSTGSGEYLYGSPGMIQAPVIWGLRIVANRYVPQASPLIGDATGATLLVREGVNVKVSDSDQDDFIKNRITMLAEARVAFPIWRPSAFAKAPLG